MDELERLRLEKRADELRRKIAEDEGLLSPFEDLEPMPAHLFIKSAPPMPESFLGGWLRPGTGTLIYGPGGVGKSLFVAQMLEAASSAEHSEFLGMSVNKAPYPIWYVDGEMPRPLFAERLKHLSSALHDNLLIISRDMFPKFRIDNEFARQRLLALAERDKPQVIVLDNKSSLFSMEDENLTTEWLSFMEYVRALRSLGAAVLVLHHANKSGGARGSTSATDMVDTAIEISWKKTKEGIDYENVTVSFTKYRLGQRPPSKNVIIEDGRFRTV